MANFGQLILFDNNFLKDDVYKKEKYIISKSNQHIINLLSDFSLWKVDKFLLLFGSQYSGKTHACHFFVESHNGIVINNISSDIIYDAQFIDRINCIAIDNIEDFEEVVLFHMVNYLRAKEVYVLLTYNCKISSLQLKDLKSRLISIPQVMIEDPDDFLTKGIFHKILSDYDIKLDNKILDYLLPKLKCSSIIINDFIEKLREIIFIKKEKISLRKIQQII